jgi:hypothetical protein
LSCGDTAGYSVGSRGISEDSRRRGYFGGTFQNGGYFKGLPFFVFWFRGRVSVVEIFVFIFYYLMFFSTDGVLEESGTPMAY